ncbi:MAG: hypothetical protein JNK00_00280 [Flavipsychrobacter sp.]|nr:hypothetical protein [Flavipsychrobacter sp.]
MHIADDINYEPPGNALALIIELLDRIRPETAEDRPYNEFMTEAIFRLVFQFQWSVENTVGFYKEVYERPGEDMGVSFHEHLPLEVVDKMMAALPIISSEEVKLVLKTLQYENIRVTQSYNPPELSYK